VTSTVEEDQEGEEWFAGVLNYNGKLECFLDGLGSRFVAKLSSALMSLGRVSAGSITSSM